MSCATIRRFAPDSPFPRKTIPAKAGISQCRVPQFADSPPILRSSGRPFLRRQESHNVVCDNSPIRSRFPVPPEDHSCEGRNLTMSCATIRQFAPDSPLPRKTIPAKAGISQCRVRQFADSPPIPRPPEDHSCEGRNLTVSCATIRRFAPDSPSPRKTIPAKAGISLSCAANGGVTKAAMPPMAKRFLLSQEWSSGGRECVGVFCRYLHTTL